MTKQQETRQTSELQKNQQEKYQKKQKNHAVSAKISMLHA